MTSVLSVVNHSHKVAEAMILAGVIGQVATDGSDLTIRAVVSAHKSGSAAGTLTL